MRAVEVLESEKGGLSLFYIRMVWEVGKGDGSGGPRAKARFRVGFLAVNRENSRT
jgi:hypothetical protein